MAWNAQNATGAKSYMNYSVRPDGSRVNHTGLDPSKPDVFAQTYLRPGFDAAQSYFNQGIGGGVYDGQRVAGFTPQQNSYFSGVNQSLGQTPGYMQNAQNTVSDMAGGGATNPYFQNSLNQQLDDIQNRVNASTSGMGRYGSGAHTSVLTSELSDAASRALNDNYFGEQGLKLNAAALAPQMQNAEITRLRELLQSGSLQQSQRQDELNAARDLFNEKEQAPWNQLSRYMSSLQGGGTVMPQQQQQQPQASAAQRGLGGALTGASIGGMFGQPLLGAAAGGALGLFG